MSSKLWFGAVSMGLERFGGGGPARDESPRIKRAYRIPPINQLSDKF